MFAPRRAAPPCDLLIVGAGTAGLELARIASRAGQRVTLIEEGSGSGRHLYQRVPLLVGKLISQPRYLRHLSSLPQPSLDGRQTPIAVGRGLGGSSRVNGNVAIAGPLERYLRAFPFWPRAMIEAVLKGVHRSGGLDLTPAPAWCDALGERFLYAARAALGEVSDPLQEAAPLPVNTRNGYRFNHFDAFLRNGVHERITILRGAWAVRLELKDARVRGVVLRRAQGGEELLCAREVVLAAGTVGSAELLLRSGIGGAGALKQAKIPCRHDLPHVGLHVKDHANLRLSFATPGYDTLNQKARLPWALWEGVKLLSGQGTRSILSGPGASSGVNFALGEDPFAHAVRLQLVHFTQDRAALARRGIAFERARKASIGVYALWPKAEGSLTLGPEGAPCVTPAFLADPSDVFATRAGLARARALIEAMGFEPPAPLSDEEELAFLRANAYSGYHLIGSCRMGEGPESSVIGPDFRLHGLANLSVVDASALPDHLSSHSYLPSLAMARFASVMRGWEGGL